MYYGVAYYPEHWPEERWAVDAQLMQDAGLTGVRMGEFAWSRLEPKAGRYDFAWLDRAVELLGEHGVKTMMCTCSRTPPPWVFHRHPEIRNVRADGHVANYGHRYTVCHNNPVFVELSRRIDRAVIEHYAAHEHVMAWHIDNEIGSGNTCYCETCRAKFIDYLREKYRTVERLNEAWGAHFWSFAFSDFDEVPLPVGVSFPSPNLAMEYARFQSKTNVDFARWRYELMKELDPKTWVTTNFQTSNRTHTDIFDLGEATDVYGTNFYPPFAPEFALDYCRGARGELLILEQRSGQPHWDVATRPGWMRLWSYRSLAHGACGINYFRWRPCRWGQEEYWHGVLPHSGQPTRQYEELQHMGRELQQVGALIDKTKPQAEVAIVMGYDARWALNAVLPPGLSGRFRQEGLDVHSAAEAYHAALMGVNVTTDAMDPREDLSKYKLVIAPRLYCTDDPTAENLRAYVSDGGILCLTSRSGVVDEYNKIFSQPAPGPLREMAGVEIHDYGALETPLPLDTKDGALSSVFEGERWADEIVTTTAQVLAEYAAGWLAGTPAITVNDYGKGKVVYVGTLLRGPSLGAFVTWLTGIAGVSGILSTPEHVRAYERRSETERLLFLLNFGDEATTVSLGTAWNDAFTDKSTDAVILPPAGVSLLKKEII
ncbi:MAG: beta-galactosidase [Anaerolineae bacterium]